MAVGTREQYASVRDPLRLRLQGEEVIVAHSNGDARNKSILAAAKAAAAGGGVVEVEVVELVEEVIAAVIVVLVPAAAAVELALEA